MTDLTDVTDLINDARPDAELTHEEIVARNLLVVQAHFHNENPDDVDKAIGLYADTIVWEAPCRGQVYTNPVDVKAAYLGIFRSIKYNKTTTLRRFATETSVFDDQIADVEIIGDEMPNLRFPIGTRVNARLVHCFEMRDGKIVREIAYEMLREFGGPEDHDAIPEGADVTVFDSSRF